MWGWLWAVLMCLPQLLILTVLIIGLFVPALTIREKLAAP